jgi:hypothetical protein
MNVMQALVEMMLADLERAGYLRAVADDGTRCAGCGLQPARFLSPAWRGRLADS